MAEEPVQEEEVNTNSSMSESDGMLEEQQGMVDPSSVGKIVNSRRDFQKEGEYTVEFPDGQKMVYTSPLFIPLWFSRK